MKTILLECEIKDPTTLSWTKIKKRFYARDNVEEFLISLRKQGYEIKHLDKTGFEKGKTVIKPLIWRISTDSIKDYIDYELKEQGYTTMLFLESKTQYIQVARVFKPDLDHARQIPVYIPFFRYNSLENEFKTMDEALQYAITWEQENTLGNGFLKQYDIYQESALTGLNKWAKKIEARKHGVSEEDLI